MSFALGCFYLLVAANKSQAAPIPHVALHRAQLISADNEPTATPNGLSTEAIIAVVAVAVAVFGIVLPFIWPSIKTSLAASRRRYSRSRPSSIGMFLPAILQDATQY
jgi:hypothetical protein